MTEAQAGVPHRLPSLRLLLSPGIRIYTFIFTLVTLFLFLTTFIGQAVRYSQTWVVVFTVGAAMACTYLVLSPLALSEKIRGLLLSSKTRMRLAAVLLVYTPMIAGITYWISQTGSVEALPIFTAFIVIFYVWLLLQAYFIAAPVSHLLARVESSLTGEGQTRKIVRNLSPGILFLPIIPLVYGVWYISVVLNTTYQSIPDASGTIVLWTVALTVLLVSTFVLVVKWGMRVIRAGRPQSAVFAGGTFALLWGYLLYRASSMLMGYISQTQPSNTLLDIILMIVAIFGAMQTFGQKIISRPDRRWGQVFPFLAFSFGSIYAVSQLYFILQIPISRTQLSIFINATIFASGILTMMILIRKHLSRAPPSKIIERNIAVDNSTAKPEGSFNRTQPQLSRMTNPFRHQDESSSTEEHRDPDY